MATQVFEVNSSVLRCGRLLLSQLTEATQSHQMDLESIKPSAIKSKSEIINQIQIKPASCELFFVHTKAIPN